MYALGNLYRTMGRKQEAMDIFMELHAVVIKTQGKASDSAIGLCRSLCDLHGEVREGGVREEEGGRDNRGIAMVEVVTCTER